MKQRGARVRARKSSPQHSSEPENAAAPKRALREQIHDATHPLRQSLIAVIARCGAGAQSPTELARKLHVEQTLAWRVWRLANAPSDEEAAQFVIGASALESFLSAAARQLTDEPLILAVRRAHQNYRQFVAQVAGDEATLRMMLAPIVDTRFGAAIAQSRMLFDAARLRIGAQAAAQLRCCVMFPSNLPGVSSAAIVDAFSDLWWLRDNGQAVLRVVRVFHEHAPRPGKPALFLQTPLDARLAKAQPSDGHKPLPLIERFCSGNSTQIRADRFAGSTLYSIHSRAVGRDRASTVCFGELLHNYIKPLSQDPHLGFSTYTLVPSEALMLEVYVARPLVERGYTFRPLINDALFRPPEAGLFGPDVDVSALGGSFQAAEPADGIDNALNLPWYGELLDFVFRSVGCARGNFFCYRIRLPMPPLGLMVSLVAGAMNS